MKAEKRPTVEGEVADGCPDLVSDELLGLVQSLVELHHQAVDAYTPVVEDILRTRSRDTRQIEHILDGLLGFCGDKAALQLYRRLCRHLWDLDQEATVAYVRFYREMYEEE